MRRHPRRQHGFTLVELLVVIGIIVLLASILIPTISHVRTTVHQTATASRVQVLMAAIDNYFHANNAYPGPIADANLSTGTFTPNKGMLQIPDISTNKPVAITGTENLTLALSGGVSMTKDVSGNPQLVYDPAKVGNGPWSLNPFKPATRYGPYVQSKEAGLEQQASGGLWVSWADPNHPGDPVANHSLYSDDAIPEYTDAYPDAMPILYVRAVTGVSGSIIGASDGTNTVAQGNAAFDPTQLQPYVFPSVDPTSGQTSPAGITNNQFSGTPDPQVLADFNQLTGSPPITPANYFGQYTAPFKPRHNGYLLITAGPDRKYMTHDDTINNGSAVK